MKFFYCAFLLVISISTSFSQSEEELSRLPFDDIRDTIHKYSNNNLEKANTAANAYILKSKRDNDLEKEWLGIEAIAITYYKNRMFTEASTQSEKSLRFAKEHNLPKLEMRSLAFLGDLQLVVTNVATQLEYYDKLLNLAELHNNDTYTQLALNKIAYVLAISGDMKKAIEIQKKSLVFYQQKDVDTSFTQKSKNSNIVNLYGSLAQSYIKLEKLDSAKLYAAYIRKFSEKELDSCYFIWSYITDGEIAYAEKRFKEARMLYQKAFDVCPSDDNRVEVNEAYLLGKTEVGAGNYEKAIKILQKGLDDYKVTSAEEGFMKDYYEKLAEAYKQTGDFEKASYYFEKYLTTQEKYSELKDSAKKKFLENERESFRKEFSTLKNEKEENQTYLNYLFLGASLLILGLLFISLRFYKTKKKNEAKFEALLKKMKISSEERSNIIDTKDEVLEGKNSADIPEEIKQQILEGLKKLEEKEYFLKQDCNSHNVAKKINTNTTYLSKVINSHYGKNFNTYINDLRMNYTIVRLKNDVIFRSYSIQSIAEEVGYKSADSFTKYFKRDTGMNPSFYIKEIKNIS